MRQNAPRDKLAIVVLAAPEQIDHNIPVVFAQARRGMSHTQSALSGQTWLPENSLELKLFERRYRSLMADG